MAKANSSIFNRRLLADVIAGVAGTVIGLVLTVGVTYCSERSSKREMSRKTVTLTIHNIDASVSGMRRLVEELESQQEVIDRLAGRRDGLAEVSADTLEAFVAAFYSRHIRPIDSSTETVFSTNFEVWRYLDDPKVIGRIANCYSLLRSCSEEYVRLEQEKRDAYVGFYDSPANRSPEDDRAICAALLQRNDVERIITDMPQEIEVMHRLLDNVEALNARNKAELGLSQEELDEIGRLL